MKLDWSIIILVVLGLLAAVSAAVLVSLMRVKSVREAVRLPPSEVTILTAAEDLPSMTVLKADLIAARTVKTAQAPAGYFGEPAQVVGRIVSVPVVQGQAFTRSTLLSEGTGAQLATLLPYGKRAVTIGLDEGSGLVGLLYPGCMVDVMAAFRLSGGQAIGTAVSTTLLENIQVLAVERDTVGSPQTPEEEESAVDRRRPGRRQALVTLMVNSEQAKALQLAKDFGNITLTMRNPKDKESDESDATLLSQGRLAQLAQVMDSSVSELAEGPALEPEADARAGIILAPAPRPVASAPRTPHLTVDIIRGIVSETVSFPGQN